MKHTTQAAQSLDNKFLLTKGFTLIEMIIVVAIVGVLAGAVIPFVRYSELRVKERELRQSLREIRLAIDAYRKAVEDGRVVRKLDSSGYPPDLNVLVRGVADAKSTGERKIYFLRRIPSDPFAEPGVKIENMWGLRSYASSPEAPEAGEDVYDVYSLSDGKGSNGVPYKNW